MEITIPTVDDVGKAGKEFAAAMGDSRVFAFHGRMGAGKTTLIKAICESLGVRDTVNSPTFAIVNEYLDGRGESVYHFDFYRINRIEEAQDIGFDDYVYSGNICLMEWPERVEPLLPADTVHVVIEEQADGTRRVAW